MATKTSKNFFPKTLVGMHYVVWGENKELARQGFVRMQIGMTHLMCCDFDWLVGQPCCDYLVSLDTLAVKSGMHDRSPGSWEFFISNSEFQNWMDAHPGARTVEEGNHP